MSTNEGKALICCAISPQSQITNKPLSILSLLHLLTTSICFIKERDNPFRTPHTSS